jgi:predicted acylesterase/phospholipase RssA
MKKLGLALSGGGFRATLYHLGLIRFLRDAGLLSQVTHITSVSGGSIVAAHLGLNWGRYTGSPSEFDSAAHEIIDFTRMDLRNRIVRRYGLAFGYRWARRFLGMSNRLLTRTGLLEAKYKKYLYGEASLFQLPESPSLYLLATNLSEGRLCSFQRDGIRIVRPDRTHGFRIDPIPSGLMPVAMAVTASSAFPGFFPPLLLSGADVNANNSEFGRQIFTDGAVFDNLGVRMFRYLERSIGKDQFPWDSVIVSDVGKPFEILTNVRAAGLIRTAMRASDILMDRVWQLENETFQDSTGFVFARVTDTVSPVEDPTAPHLEVQRQLPNVRTDLDRFSPTEISALIRHGYCIVRKACRAHPDVFGTNLPADPPWDPFAQTRAATNANALVSGNGKERQTPSPLAQEARTLHASSQRRIWSRVLDYRDWVSYIYVPILIPILVLLPYVLVKSYQRSHRMSQIIDSLAQGSRDLEQMSNLLDGPVEPWVGERPSELLPNEKPDPKGFVILQDSRIIDLRKWTPAAAKSNSPEFWAYGYRRLKVQKKPESANNNFGINVLAYSPDTQVRFPPQQLKPRVHSQSTGSSALGEKLVHWTVSADFQKVPAGDAVDIVYEHLSPGLFVRDSVDSSSLAFEIETETVELTRWLLLPKGKEYRNFQLIRYETGKPETTERVRVVTEYLADDYTILAFKLLSLKAGYTYELTWFYR